MVGAYCLLFFLLIGVEVIWTCKKNVGVFSSCILLINLHVLLSNYSGDLIAQEKFDDVVENCCNFSQFRISMVFSIDLLSKNIFNINEVNSIIYGFMFKVL